MSSTLRSPVRFLLERWIQRGVLHQLALMAALIASTAVVGGIAAWLFTPQFTSPGTAIWWSFLRLTDPGYLGDDEGTALRVISTIVTILGYVLFMGSMIAVMTQWLFGTMRRLESGLTPISMREHVVVLGWTNRTPEIVLQLMTAQGRLKRFLERSEARKLRIVVQAEEVDAEVRGRLRDHLGKHWNEGQVFLRSGSALNAEHLKRLDLDRASVVLIPGADFAMGGADASDARVIKTLLTVDKLQGDLAAEQRPFVVAELFDAQKVPLAEESFEGPLEVLSSDQIISRLLSQSLRHQGLARGLIGLLSHRRGNSMYVRGFPELRGRTPRTLFGAFPKAIVLGSIRSGATGPTADLDPRSDVPLGAEDLLVLLAMTYDDCAAVATGLAAPLDVAQNVPAGEAEPSPTPAVAEKTHRILVLGWSHKLGSLARELVASRSGHFDVTVMSRFPAEERRRWLESATAGSDRVRFRHVEGDYSIASELDAQDLQSFDHVALLASDWMSTSEQADARTVLGHVLVRSRLRGVQNGPEVIVEFLDPKNCDLFEERCGEFLVTPQVLSYLLAHTAMRPELAAAYEELFSSQGAEISLQSVEFLGLAERSLTFPEVQQAAFARGVTALGILPEGGDPRLNPDRSEVLHLTRADRILVLTCE
ncbi:hypothetical protein Poly30_05920 [Planctomycetes bacterium Poly30]|uniref:CASTOR/POLLUX/SYM8 ion channel conserved domain-containing protein n=1 Tax=Saltatorellus ferox TaxID=2528018 RepID=A0A518ELX9_9BACT|nr:hypothetical protein Poly30_05920 [Planctomycetes bacterium Poly30]